MDVLLFVVFLITFVVTLFQHDYRLTVALGVADLLLLLRLLERA